MRETGLLVCLDTFCLWRVAFFFCVSDGILFANSSKKYAEAHTVVSADFQPRCGVKIGTLPRNHLAVSATGGASAVSSE